MSDLDKLPASADVAVTDDLTAGGDVEPEAFPESSPSVPQVDEHNSSDDEDDGEVEIAVPAAAQRVGTSFCLKGGSAGFSSRSHCIFDSLDTVAKLTASGLEQVDGVFARPLPPVNKKSRQSPSICSRPLPTEKRAVPDYMVHPERWTYYNLEDVAETSDRSNSRVAHQFLASLKRKNEQEPETVPNTCSPQQKMIFSRPSRPGKEQSAEKLSAVKDNKKGMHLSHLEEEEDEEVAGKEREEATTINECRYKDIDKTKQKEDCINHEEQEDDLQKVATTVRQPDETENKRGQPKKDPEEDEGKKKEQASTGFVSFRKMNQKNYRRGSEHGDA
ncbi:protein TSSC4 [Thalassophryne amazonica]|uniref:protein TSSC4 n=1 Tax=Thalassophryne amazonica TaxID=390379 RepID=UPI001471019E|nr:protein TSSC4 [Thalassophryne amazonica]